MSLGEVRIKYAYYENIHVNCPYCCENIIYNRISDLGDLKREPRREVRCLNSDCKHKFIILSDSVNSKYEMFINEACMLLKQKKYSQIILNICQAYEVFFGLFFRKKLIYQPAIKKKNIEGYININEINRWSSIYYKEFKGYSYVAMRNFFINYIVNDVENNSCNKIEDLITIITKKEYKRNPSDKDIKKNEENKMIRKLIKLKNSEINSIRNQVIHKDAFLPNKKTAEEHLKEAKELLNFFAKEFGIEDDDINTYLFK